MRDLLGAFGVELIACNWAPDMDTITDALLDNLKYGTLKLIDLNR